MLIFFHILVLLEYWVLTESRIPLKPVLGREGEGGGGGGGGGGKSLHFPLVLMNRLNKTKSAVFLYCRFSLFLKDPFFQII